MLNGEIYISNATFSLVLLTLILSFAHCYSADLIFFYWSIDPLTFKELAL